MIFSLFSRYLEEYNARQRNYTDLFRTFILAMVLLGAVVIKHLKKASKGDANDDNNTITCWENQVGEQMYQLLILFFIILVVWSLLFETIQGLVYR